MYPQKYDYLYIEHIVYSAAIAVIVGMFFSRYTGRDPSWIILVIAFVPDVDELAQIVQPRLRFLLTFRVHHGDFHNILILIVFSFIIAAILIPIGIKFFDGLICSAIGIAAHLFEDALIYKPGYAFLWPFTGHLFGLGILPEERNFFGIATDITLVIGIILLICAICIRIWVEGIQWWKIFLRGDRG